MNKNVTLISSGQISANPRLVKEAQALAAAGYLVTVVYCLLSDWADEFDHKIIQENPGINWVSAGFSAKKNPFIYKLARIRRKFYETLFKTFNHQSFAVKGLVLYSQELYKKAKKYKADIYIGHNLGALPAVVKLAKANKAISCFDAEDFHRGELSNGDIIQKMAVNLEGAYFPKLNKLTAASPLIAEAYYKIYPFITPVTINNVFSIKFLRKENLAYPAENSNLKLFWFSQFIGKKRGLENVIAALGILNEYNITLTLLGSCNAEMKNYFTELSKTHKVHENRITFLEPVASDEIFKIAAEHHIGLATEIPHCLNRELCLTNKIFTYLLAGNALVMSDTKAQELFLQQNTQAGSLFNAQSPESLAEVLKEYYLNSKLLHQHRENSLALACSKYNWENEGDVFLDNLKKTTTFN